MTESIETPKRGREASEIRRFAAYAQQERLTAKTYRHILDLILSGKARPGDHLNERAPAEMLDMSRTPVRDALLMLETEGLIMRNGRMGVQINPMRIGEFLDALQIRLLLERAVALGAARRNRVALGFNSCLALPDLL